MPQVPLAVRIAQAKNLMSGIAADPGDADDGCSFTPRPAVWDLTDDVLTLVWMQGRDPWVPELSEFIREARAGLVPHGCELADY